MKRIFAALPTKPAVNPQAMWDFLRLRYVPPPMTIWQGIFKLEPGHMLRYSLKTRQARIERFWQPNFTPDELDSGRDYALAFERQFLAAVGCHLTAPSEPLGLFLSGGLGPAALCAP